MLIEKSENPQSRGVQQAVYRISSIPLQLDAVPDRPKLLLELGDTFLGTGALGLRYHVANWVPCGVHRCGYLERIGRPCKPLITARHDFPNGPIGWTCLPILKLSASERILLGFRPLDQDGRVYQPDR